MQTVVSGHKQAVQKPGCTHDSLFLLLLSRRSLNTRANPKADILPVPRKALVAEAGLPEGWCSKQNAALSKWLLLACYGYKTPTNGSNVTLCATRTSDTVVTES